MTWNEFEALLKTEAETLSGGEISKKEMSGADFLRLHERTRQAVDEAIVAFSKTRSWPRLEEEAEQMLRYRIQIAQKVVASLSGLSADLQDEPSITANSDLIQSILIHAWENEGIRELTGKTADGQISQISRFSI